MEGGLVLSIFSAKFVAWYICTFKFIFTKHDLNMQNFRTFSRRTSACFLGWEISRHSGLKPLQLTGVTFDQVKADSAERALGSAWLRSLLSFCSFFESFGI